MDIILIAVTLLSLIVAVVMSVIAGRLIRDDRRRSAARVEALAAEADIAEERRAADTDRPRARVVPAAADPTWLVREGMPVVPVVAAPAPPAGLEPASPKVRERAPVVSSQDPAPVSDAMFGAVQRAPQRSVKPLAIAAVCGVFALVAAAVFFTSSSAEEPVARPRAVSDMADTSLELLSLTHARADGEWRIAGTVRNSESSSEMGNVTVLAFLFDEAGSSVGSGRAQLELPRLGAGETSPFSIVVAPTGPVARYRIGFRGEDGRVIRHFDRRPAPPQQARQ